MGWFIVFLLAVPIVILIARLFEARRRSYNEYMERRAMAEISHSKVRYKNFAPTEGSNDA